MPTPALSEALRIQALDAFRRAGGNKTHAAGALGMPVQTFTNRLRRALETFPGGDRAISGTRVTQRIRTEIKDGVAIAISDCHFWPDYRSAAHEALLKLAPKLKPVALIDVGDSLDGASISRHPMSGNDDLPSVTEEIFAVLEHRGAIMGACGNARLYWILGNHDQRLSAYLAQHAPKLAELKGTTLNENLPGWRICYGLEVNWETDPLLVLHNWKGGMNAGLSNVVASGVNFMSGHDHKLGLSRYTSERGDLYGINPGTLADPNAPSFRYLQGRPRDWRSGWAVLTFRDSKLLCVEHCEVRNGRAVFRGEVV